MNKLVPDPSQHGWVEVDGKWMWGASGGTLGEAPTDGLIYGRQNADWVEIVPADNFWTSTGANEITYSGTIVVNGNVRSLGDVTAFFGTTREVSNGEG